VKLLLILGLIFSSSPLIFAEEICSNINFCQAKKMSYRKKGWITNYTKEISIKDLCHQHVDTSHALQLEPELGIQLQVLSGTPSSNNPIEKKPWLLVELFTYKLTFIVASSKVSLDSSSLNFTHRLTPRGNSIIEVSCYKKDN
jgi:hypothetical protein